ncbi:MAG: hypothetical protein LBR39_02930 [Coriobacteriales bacterium]|jgi:hypothetical protein|nr:hypothetical protein [Coriobacteriales bacterium]
MDWHSSNRQDEFYFTSVDPETMRDTGFLDMLMDGATVERNALTATKTAATVPFYSQLPEGNYWMRLYSRSTLGDDVATLCLGTFMPSVPARTVEYAMSTGSANLYSLLHLLEEQLLPYPLSLAAGTQSIAKAVELAQECGLATHADSSASVLQSTATFDAGTSYMEVVNWLLDYAGFRSVDIDPQGAALMRRYYDPALDQPAYTLTDDGAAAFAPQVTHEMDEFAVPNRLVALCSNQEQTLTAVVDNDDPANRYSIPSRGRVIATAAEIEQIDSQEALEAWAASQLYSKTSAVESVTITTPYQPWDINDAVRIEYKAAGLDFTGTVVSKSMALTPGMPTSTRLRRFVRF